MIPQKKKLLNYFLEISINDPYQIAVKKMGHRASLRDMMGQSYPIYDCTGYNNVRYFIGSTYVLQ